MKTLKLMSTDQNAQSNSEEEMMSNTSISVGLAEAGDQGVSNESIATVGSDILLENGKEEEKGQRNKFGLAFHLISSLLLVLIGIVVLKVTGLYDGMTSTAGKFTLCAVISYCYLIVFRSALYSSR